MIIGKIQYDINDINIGMNIRHYRILNDISPKYIAKRLKISVSTYHKIERGERSLKASEIPKICELLIIDFRKIYEK